MNLLDIGGGFPAPYDATVKPFRELAKVINRELNRLFPKNIQILAEPGRFLVRHRRHRRLQDHRQGRARRQTLLLHQRRRLSHLLRRHLRPLPLPPEIVQARADADLLGVRPDVRRAGRGLDGGGTAGRPATGRPALQREIGAYSHASSTWFNGFPPATVVHINQSSHL
jgi:ornithine decarboxylase